jgi:hypothetical protein
MSSHIVHRSLLVLAETEEEDCEERFVLPKNVHKSMRPRYQKKSSDIITVESGEDEFGVESDEKRSECNCGGVKQSMVSLVSSHGTQCSCGLDIPPKT